MTKTIRNLNIDAFKQSYNYDPVTGYFTRIKVRPNQQTRNGGSCGAGTVVAPDKKTGYIRINFGGVVYLGHQLAFACMGVDVPVEIDHIDLDRSNNAWNNLRPASRSTNGANLGMKKNNSSGYKGVFFRKDRKKWMAFIQPNRKFTHLGYFDTPEEAHEAYKVAAVKYFGEFANFG